MGFGSITDERFYNQISPRFPQMFERWTELQGAQGQESREPDVKALKLNAALVVGWR